MALKSVDHIGLSKGNSAMDEKVRGYFWTDAQNLAFASIAIVYFTCVIAFDVWGGYRKRTYWIPGKYLVLSALTIQALSYLDVASVSLSDNPDIWGISLLLGNHLLIDNGRLIICVFMGYLLPGMAASGSKDKWGDILALAISLFSNIASELYFLYKAEYLFNDIRQYFSYYEQYGLDYNFEYDVLSRLQQYPSILRWYKASSLATVVAVVFLLFVLASVIPTGSTIREILSQKIAGVLINVTTEGRSLNKSRREQEGVLINVTTEGRSLNKSRREQEALKEFEEKVFKSWLLAHVCRPDSVIARSVMSSAAAMVVTLRVGFSIGKLVFLKYHYVVKYHDGLDKSRVPLLVIQFLFIGVGWLAICWRAATAVLYFPKSNRQILKNMFRVDNLWKRRVMGQRYRWQSQIADLKQERKNDFTSVELPLDPEIWLLIVAEKCLPYALTKLQWLVVFFANVCWFLSSIVVGNRLLRWFFVRDDCSIDLHKYDDILQRVTMPEETEHELRTANWKAIKQTEELMKKGRQAGIRCTELIDFIKSHEVSEPKFEAIKKVEDSFSSLDKMCWMMKAVCCFEIIAEVLPERKERNEKLLDQAADIMNFLDRVDLELDEMSLLNTLGKAADTEFRRVRKPQNQPSQNVWPVSEAKRRIEKIVMEHEELLDKYMGLILGHEGAVGMKEIAHSYSLYKVGKYLLQTIEDDLEKDTDEAFSNLIGYCVLQLKLLLEKECVYWAREFDDHMLRKAVFIAGKAKVVLEQSKVHLQSADATVAR